MNNPAPYILAFAMLIAAPVFANAQKTESVPSAAAPAPESESIPALPIHKPKNAPVSEEDRITHEVRHELVLQPYYTIWDWLAFRVNGSTVELLGDAYSARPAARCRQLRETH